MTDRICPPMPPPFDASCALSAHTLYHQELAPDRLEDLLHRPRGTSTIHSETVLLEDAHSQERGFLDQAKLDAEEASVTGTALEILDEVKEMVSLRLLRPRQGEVILQHLHKWGKAGYREVRRLRKVARGEVLYRRRRTTTQERILRVRARHEIRLRKMSSQTQNSGD